MVDVILPTFLKKLFGLEVSVFTGFYHFFAFHEISICAPAHYSKVNRKTNRLAIIDNHYVKSVRIWSYSGPYFSVRTEYGDTEYLSVFIPNVRKTNQNNTKYGHFSCSEYHLSIYM